MNGLSQTQKSTASRYCTASGTSQELSPCKVTQQSAKVKHTVLLAVSFYVPSQKKNAALQLYYCACVNNNIFYLGSAFQLYRDQVKGSAI